MKLITTVLFFFIGSILYAQSHSITRDNITLSKDTVVTRYKIYFPPLEKMYYREPENISFIFIRKRVFK